MTTLAKSAVLGIALIALAVALTFFTNPVVQAAPGPTNVNVVNTAANAVPTVAQGITNISGTVGLAAGSSLAVANPLNSTGAAVPLLTRDVDTAGLNPFALNTSCTGACAVNFPATSASGAPIQTVVIDFLSAICTGLGPGGTPFTDNFNLTLQLHNQPYGMFFPVSVDVNAVGRLAQQTTLYVDPGDVATFGTPGNNTGCTIAATGHVIPQ